MAGVSGFEPETSNFEGWRLIYPAQKIFLCDQARLHALKFALIIRHLRTSVCYFFPNFLLHTSMKFSRDLSYVFSASAGKRHPGSS